MSLIDRLIEPTKDYINFRDFLFHLSSSNNEPLYEVVTYLLHHDLNSIGFYNIDTDYKIIKFEPFEFNSVTEFLEEVQKALEISACKWVFSSSESLDELIQNDRKLLTDAVSKAMHSFFKKSELLSFRPLDGLLHFDSESVSDADSTEQQLANALAKIDNLEQSQSTGSFSMGTPMVEHGEPKTNEQLINELAAANDQIAKLKSQLEQPTIDKHSYTTPAINIMDKVITEFWLDYNPNQSAPKQEIIVRWITGNFDGVSKALALNIDKVCRHSDAKKGGQYKR